MFPNKFESIRLVPLFRFARDNVLIRMFQGKLLFQNINVGA